MTFWQPFWILAAILEIKENNFPRNRFLGLENIHLDLFYCLLRHLQAKICKILDFGGHLGKMADRKKCSTFEVWLQTDLDSAAQNLMETIIKVYICLKTRFSYQMLGSLTNYAILNPGVFLHLIHIFFGLCKTEIYAICFLKTWLIKIQELKTFRYFESKVFLLMKILNHLFLFILLIYIILSYKWASCCKTCFPHLILLQTI